MTRVTQSTSRHLQPVTLHWDDIVTLYEKVENGPRASTKGRRVMNRARRGKPKRPKGISVSKRFEEFAEFYGVRTHQALIAAADPDRSETIRLDAGAHVRICVKQRTVNTDQVLLVLLDRRQGGVETLCSAWPL